MENDFVILKLEYPLELNNDVQAACLPDSDDYLVNTEEEQCFTSGWGELSGEYHAPLPDICQYVRVPTMTNDNCIHSCYYKLLIKDSMICAGYPKEGGKDSCQGDSG